MALAGECGAATCGARLEASNTWCSSNAASVIGAQTIRGPARPAVIVTDGAQEIRRSWSRPARSARPGRRVPPPCWTASSVPASTARAMASPVYSTAWYWPPSIPSRPQRCEHHVLGRHARRKPAPPFDQDGAGHLDPDLAGGQHTGHLGRADRRTCKRRNAPPVGEWLSPPTDKHARLQMPALRQDNVADAFAIVKGTFRFSRAHCARQFENARTFIGISGHESDPKSARPWRHRTGRRRVP
jgi:hypothetical protein